MSFKARYEAGWIRFAARILLNRNVTRSAVVSRRDNNDMWYMAERLYSVANRIIDEYNRPEVANEVRRRESVMAMYCAGLSTDELEKRVGEGDTPTMDVDHD